MKSWAAKQTIFGGINGVILKILILLCSGLGSLAWADSSRFDSFNVECKGQDCLKNGWIIFRVLNNGREVWALETECIRGDCQKNGWESFGRNNFYSELICKGNDCFKAGWLERDHLGRVVISVVCAPDSLGGQADCLRNGWKTYMQQGETFVTSCLDGNCSGVGWEAVQNGRLDSRTLCKAGGCFSEGWNFSIFHLW